MPVPNFFLVGAHKSGTSALYAYLGQHPDIFLSPVKEPRFFVPEFRAENLAEEMQQQWREQSAALSRYLRGPRLGAPPSGAVTSWEDYLELFRGADPTKPIGEGSVAYLWSPSAPDLIAERCPDARILMILRNPVDRALSHYHAAPPHRRTESFSDAIRRSAAAPPGGPFHVFHPFLEYGLYAEQVARYRTRFSEDRVLVLLHEDFVADREGTVRRVFDFLGVDRNVPLDLSKRHNETRVPRFPALEALARALVRRWPDVGPESVRRAAGRLLRKPRGTARMAPADRAFLVDYYAEDVRRLEGRIGRDLSGWLGTSRS